ncbi:hypothetical protein SLEP1_g33371 [Rubroshorea leprosula]|uniref:Uncharacterized protein n=1 Tax=Rubroshorea leprosula TaxID=152421 RepID=A0AAV5KGF9_9ROSI|nr:hypothetical protein SLEP1_g33371 [Rubroshorea leprosula]
MNYPTLGNVDMELKSRILRYIEEEGIMDLNTLVTLEQLAFSPSVHEWLFGLNAFWDVVTTATMNTIIESYNKVCGKVLQHQPDLLINELAFMDGEEINEQGKSLTPPFETTSNVRWTLDDDGALLFPPNVLKEGDEHDTSQNFTNWVARMPPLEAKTSSSSWLPPPSTPTNASIESMPQVDLMNEQD